MALLPGQKKKLTIEVFCDDCLEEEKDVPATYEVVGEVDSFGAEYHYLCDKHTEKMVSEEDHGPCDSCGADTTLTPTRDWEEGNTGPVYYVCRSCLCSYKCPVDEDEDE